MEFGRAWIRGVLSVLAITLGVCANAQDALADYSPAPVCGDRLFARLSTEMEELALSTGQGDVPQELQQMLMQHWQSEWEKEIRRCITELYVQFGQLQRGWDPTDPSGSPLANEPGLQRWNGALPERNGRPGEKDREKPPANVRTGPGPGTNSAAEDPEFRELVLKTQRRMRTRWSALLERLGHGVERVD